MKRTLSLLLVLVMVISLIPNVFADTNKSGIDFDDIYYLDSYTPIEAEVAAGEEEAFVWAPTEDGTLTYEVPANVTITMTQGENTASGSGTVALAVVAGEDVTIVVTNALEEDAEVIITGTFEAGHDCAANAVVVEGKAATCTETGLTEGSVCSICGETLVAQEEIAALGHDYVSEKVEGGTKYTCSRCGDTYTVADVVPEFGFITQPASPSGTFKTGQTVTFTVEAAGAARYLWQMSKSGTSGWGTIPNATTNEPTLTLETSVNTEEYYYSCIIYSEAGKALRSQAVKFVIDEPISIRSQSHATNDVVLDTGFTFYVDALSKSGAEVKYQWTVSKTGLSGWGNIAKDANGPSYSVKCNEDNQKYYSCLMSVTIDGVTKVLRSRAFTFNLLTPITIDQKPVTNNDAIPGKYVTFEAKASAETGVTYQWQASTTGVGGWFNVTDIRNTGVFQVVATLGNQMYYSCLVRDGAGNVRRTNNVTYKMAAPSITRQSETSFGAKAGSTVQLYVQSDAVDPIYQWQISKNGKTGWGSIYLPATNILELPATASNAQWYYRCVVADPADQLAISQVMKFEILPTIVIDGQSEANPVVEEGGKVTFTIAATGDTALTYQWQKSSTGTGGWGSISGATSTSMTLDATAANQTYYYSCLITDSVGNVLRSQVFRFTFAG